MKRRQICCHSSQHIFESFELLNWFSRFVSRQTFGMPCSAAMPLSPFLDLHMQIRCQLLWPHVVTNLEETHPHLMNSWPHGRIQMVMQQQHYQANIFRAAAPRFAVLTIFSSFDLSLSCRSVPVHSRIFPSLPSFVFASLCRSSILHQRINTHASQLNKHSLRSSTNTGKLPTPSSSITTFLILRIYYALHTRIMVSIRTLVFILIIATCMILRCQASDVLWQRRSPVKHVRVIPLRSCFEAKSQLWIWQTPGTT